MREPENIRALLSLHPDYIGFIFYPRSQRFVASIDQLLLNEIPAEVKKTGVFVNSSEDDILDKIKSFSLNAVQLHGAESPELCRKLKDAGMEVLKAFGVDENFDFTILNAYAESVDFFLFDTKTQQHGGSGKTFNWSLLGDYNLSVPYFLSGGLDENNIREALEIEDQRFYAVDLNSRFEIEPALKDIQKLRTTINEIKKTSAKAD